MVAESPTQMARDAKHAIDLLKQTVGLLAERFDELDLLQLRERVMVVEQLVPELVRRATEVEELHKQVALLESQVAEFKKTRDEFVQLSKMSAVIEDRVNKIEKRDEESGKRGWQWLYGIVGVILALFSSLLVQLILAWVKSSPPTPHP